MTFRLLGMTEEERLDFEQTTGIRTEGAVLIAQTAVQEAERLMQTAIREVQGVIGPHGSVTRLQAGGVNISPGGGVSVFEDGVLKTTIYPDGNFRAGANVEDPTTTSFCVFVNEQTYNNETMGAGDLLIGDNTAATSNVKYDASDGQLQFRYGTTIQAYMDTDGSLKAGAGVVTLDVDGITITSETTDESKQYKFEDSNAVYYGGISGETDAGSVEVNLTATGVPSNKSALSYVTAAANAAKTALLTLRALVQGESTFPYIDITKSGSGADIVSIQGNVRINDVGSDVDTRIEGDTDQNLVFVDASTDRVGIGTATPSYKLDVNGDVNVASGSVYRVNGSTVLSGTVTGVTNGDSHDHSGGDGAQISYPTLSNKPIAETQTEDIFRVGNPGGTSAFAGTIATLPGGATLTYNVTSGTEGAMVPFATTQLGKMRLYNTTRGTSALISNCNTGTNTITLTANVPGGWALTDVITIASQTVSGGGFGWVDIEITSGPTGKTYMFLQWFINSATPGDAARLHPLETHATSKYKTMFAQVNGITNVLMSLLPITSNVFSLSWTGTPTAVIVREEGYLE